MSVHPITKTLVHESGRSNQALSMGEILTNIRKEGGGVDLHHASFFFFTFHVHVMPEKSRWGKFLKNLKHVCDKYDMYVRSSCIIIFFKPIIIIIDVHHLSHL